MEVWPQQACTKNVTSDRPIGLVPTLIHMEGGTHGMENAAQDGEVRLESK